MARCRRREIERLKGGRFSERLAEARGSETAGSEERISSDLPFHEDRTPSLADHAEEEPGATSAHRQADGERDRLGDARSGVSFRHAVETPPEGLPLLSCRRAKRPARRGSSEGAGARCERDDELLTRVADYTTRTRRRSPERERHLASRGLDHPELVSTLRLSVANRTLRLSASVEAARRGQDAGRLQRFWRHARDGARASPARSS